MTLASPTHTGFRQPRQLIVLIPASEPVSPEQANRIWEIARAKDANVTLLSLIKNPGEESQVRCNLITMAAIINYPGVSTDIKVGQGTDWVEQVKRIWQAGDSVACFEDHRFGFFHKSLDQILEVKMAIPVYKLSRYQPTHAHLSKFWSDVAAWLGSLVIIGGFLWAEIKIVELSQDWAHTFLIYFFVLVVIALLWFWNSLFS